MRINSKARFAVIAMLDIAHHESLGPVPLHDISSRHNISLSYLESMFSCLRKNGLIKSTRGPGGGYSLAKNVDSITVAEIFESFNEDIYAINERSSLDVQSKCLEVDVWAQLNIKAMEFLQSIQLASLIDKEASCTNSTKPKVSSSHGIHKRPDILLTAKRVPNSVFALGQIVAT